jgi:hypothetical protein
MFKNVYKAALSLFIFGVIDLALQQFELFNFYVKIKQRREN